MVHEYVADKIEGVEWSKNFFFGHQAVFFDQLKVENVVDEAQEQVDLADHELQKCLGLGTHQFHEQALQEDQRLGKGQSQLISNGRLRVDN